MSRLMTFPGIFNSFKKNMNTKTFKERMAVLALLGNIERQLCSELALFTANNITHITPMTEVCTYMRKEDHISGNKRKTRKYDLGLFNNGKMKSLVEAKYVTNLHGNTKYPANDNIKPSITKAFSKSS